MSSPHTGGNLAQMCSGVGSQNILTKTETFNQPPPPANDEKPAHQPNRAVQTSGDEDLATEQAELRQERTRSQGLEKREFQEIMEKRELSEKRGRSKRRHKIENGDEGGTEGGPSKSRAISKQISHKGSVPFSRRTRSRGFSRSKSAVSKSKRKRLGTSNDDERRRLFEEMIDKSLQPNPGVVANAILSTKTKWAWTGKIIYDGASSALSLFVSYFLKYLVMFFMLVLLISITHRAICEISLVRYYHLPCSAVWAPTSLSTDPQQEHALSQLADPMQRHTEYLNQLQGNEYFSTLPLALFKSSQWMRSMKNVLQVSLPETPSKQKTVEALRQYVIESKETGEKVSKLRANIPSTVGLLLGERQILVETLEQINSKANENSALTSFFDIPSLLWSSVATPLLDRRVLTPYQARQLEGEQARVDELKFFFPRFCSFLDKLAKNIQSVQDAFETLNSSVNDIQSCLLLDISQVSTSRDLLSLAESHPYERFRAILGIRTQLRLDLNKQESQLELLFATNATVTITIRELIVMADVVRKLQDDMSIMMDTLDLYEASLNMGKISIDGLLGAMKIGIEALARGRVAYWERRKQWEDKESRESDEENAKIMRKSKDRLHKFGIATQEEG